MAGVGKIKNLNNQDVYKDHASDPMSQKSEDPFNKRQECDQKQCQRGYCIVDYKLSDSFRVFQVNHRKHYSHDQLGSKEDENPHSVAVPSVGFTDLSLQYEREAVRQSA